MNTAVSNNQRHFRASRPDGISMPSKGNRNSSFAGQIAQRDTQPAFHGQRYQVRPYVEIEGIFFDDNRRLGIVPGAEKTKKAPAARKARTRRQDPGAGTRPSLSTMRQKG